MNSALKSFHEYSDVEEHVDYIDPCAQNKQTKTMALDW